jgi:hypothetical protein
MPLEIPFLLVLLAATAPELARLLSAALGLVAVPLAYIRQRFLNQRRAAVSSVKQVVGWCWACIRRLTKSEWGITSSSATTNFAHHVSGVTGETTHPGKTVDHTITL